MKLEDLPNNPLSKQPQILSVMNEDGTCMIGVHGTAQERMALLFALVHREPELIRDFAAVLGSLSVQAIQLEDAVTTQANKIVALSQEMKVRDREQYLSKN